MYLHLAPQRIDVIKPRGSIQPGPMAYGKPLGLWYAPGMTWIKRLDDVGQWIIDAPKFPERGDFTFTLELYEKVLGKKDIPIYQDGDEMRQLPAQHSGRHPVHYVYNFPLSDRFEEDVNKPDGSKVFKLKKSNTDAFLAGFKEYYKSTLLRQLKESKSGYMLNMIRSNDILRKPDLAEAEAYLKSKRFNLDVHPSGANIYLPILIRAFMIDELIRMGMTEDELKEHTSGFSWGSTLLVSVLKQKIPKGKPASTVPPPDPESFLFPTGFTMKTGPFLRIPLLTFGDYFENILRAGWGGVDFDQSLFDGTMNDKLPMLKWLEVPSGCLWQPDKVLAGYTPKPIAVVGLASSKEEADAYTESDIFVAGQKADGTLVLFKKGAVVGGRGRTFRRKAKRSNKNGRRSTRKSIRIRNRNA